MSERELLSTIYWALATWMLRADAAHRVLDPAAVEELRHEVAGAVAEADRGRAEALMLAHAQQVGACVGELESKIGKRKRRSRA